MKISLILMSRNEEKYVKNFFQSLNAQIRKPDEIILVDSSNDKTAELAKSYVDRLIKTPPRGCGDARLRGQAVATGDIWVYTDIDAVLDKNWLKEIENMFHNPDINAVVGMVTFKGIPTKLRANVLNGCNMAFRREIMEKFKWDLIIGEDVDMGYRLVKAGIKIYPCKSAIVYHIGSLDEPKFTHIRAGRAMALLFLKYRSFDWILRISFNIFYCIIIGKVQYAYWLMKSFIFSLYDIMIKGNKTIYIWKGYEGGEKDI